MRGQFLQGWVCCICLPLVFFMGARGWAVTPGSFYHNFVSVVDNSPQSYGIYVPTSYANYSRHAVIVIGHGFKGAATTYFSGYQQNFAFANGWLLVQVHGRGNSFYDGIGETDFFEVFADLKARGYTLDEDRLYFEGASMGATGAFRMGIRFPHIFAAVGGCDGFADYREWYAQYYSPAGSPAEVAACRVPNLLMTSCVDIAERAKWQHTWMTVDQQDGSVWPANGNHLHDKLTLLGAATTEPDFAYVYEPVPGGHCAGYNQQAMYEYFLTVTNNRYPSHVVISTNRLKYGAEYWARIDRLQTANVFGKLDATISGNTVMVATSNVLALTLTLDSLVMNTTMPLTITINGKPAYTGAAGTIALYARRDAAGAVTGWATTDPEAAKLWKRAGLEGPIGDAYTSHFTVCYGNSGTAAALTNQTEAQDFCNKWKIWMGATIVPIPDTSPTAPMIAAGHVILFGTIESSTLLQGMQGQLPIQVHTGNVVVGSASYTGSNYGAYLVYPNPQNPTKYLVVSHGTILVPEVTKDSWLSDPDAYAKDLEALPWYWPDYVVFRTNIIPRATVQPKLAYLPDAFVASGYFDVNWRIPLTALALTAAPAAPIAMGKPVKLTVTPTGGGILEYRFRLKYLTPTGYVWQNLQEYSLFNTYTWTPTEARSYLLYAYGREKGSKSTYDLYRELPFIVRSPVSAVKLTAACASPTGVGTPVKLTATPTDGGTLEYKFHALYNDAGGVQQTEAIRDYAPGNTTTWSPKLVTSYTVVALVREIGKVVPFEQMSEIDSYTVVLALRTLMLKSSTGSSAKAGVPVKFTATVTGGGTLEYQFRAKYTSPSGIIWQTLKVYGPENSYTWTPTEAHPYSVFVYAREKGTTISYKLYREMVYTVMP